MICVIVIRRLIFSVRVLKVATSGRLEVKSRARWRQAARTTEAAARKRFMKYQIDRLEPMNRRVVTAFDLFDIRIRRAGCSRTAAVGTIYDELDGLIMLMMVMVVMMTTVLVDIFNKGSREVTARMMNSNVRTAGVLVSVGDALLLVRIAMRHVRLIGIGRTVVRFLRRDEWCRSADYFGKTLYVDLRR